MQQSPETTEVHDKQPELILNPVGSKVKESVKRVQSRFSALMKKAREALPGRDNQEPTEENQLEILLSSLKEKFDELRFRDIGVSLKTTFDLVVKTGVISTERLNLSAELLVENDRIVVRFKVADIPKKNLRKVSSTGGTTRSVLLRT